MSSFSVGDVIEFVPGDELHAIFVSKNLKDNLEFWLNTSCSPPRSATSTVLDIREVFLVDCGVFVVVEHVCNTSYPSEVYQIMKEDGALLFYDTQYGSGFFKRN